MPNRIDTSFAALREAGRSGFIAYVCAGDPDFAKTAEIVAALVDAGADLIELGIPFSDPLADGVVNQTAAQRALEAGATTGGVLDLIRTIRRSSQVPIVLFTYLNPVYTYGFERFHHDASAAGADGILVLDLPPHEARENRELAESAELKHIRLIAPTTPPDRVETIARASEGFIYYVSRAGVTGARTTLSEGIAEQVAAIREHSDLPVAVGFGISTPEQTAAVAGAADAVVVGSAIVRIVEEYGAAPDVAARVHDFVKPLVEAVKSV